MPVRAYILEDGVSESQATDSVTRARGPAEKAAALYKLAKTQATCGKLAEALTSATDAVAQAKTAGDKKLEGAATHILAEVRLGLCDFKEAIQSAKDAMAIAKGAGDRRGEAICAVTVAQATLDFVGAEQGLVEARGALTLCVAVDPSCEGVAMDTLIKAYAGVGRLSEAMEIVQPARDRLRSAGSKTGEATALLKIARIHELQDEHAAAVSVSKQALSLAQEAASKPLEADARVTLARAQLGNDNSGEAVLAAFEGVKLYQEIFDPEGEVAATQVMISAHTKGGDPDEAKQCATDAMARFKDGGFKKMEATMALALAEANLVFGDIEGALVFFKRARATFNEAKDGRGEGATFKQIAQLAVATGDIDEAMWSTQRATALFRKLKDKSGEAGVLLVTADMNFAKAWGFIVQGVAEKPQQLAREALRNAQLALGLYRAVNDKHGESLALNNAANAQLMIKDSEAALTTSGEAIRLCEERALDHAKAGAMLVSSGAKLAMGLIEDAKRDAVEARQLFQQMADSMGEAAAANFVKDLRDYEAGDLSVSDFAGFYLRGTDSFQPMPEEVAAKTTKREEKKRAPQGAPQMQSHIQIFHDSTSPTTVFDGFESRQAGGSQAQGRLKRVSEEEEQVSPEGAFRARYRAEVPPVYAVRWQGVKPVEGAAPREGPAKRLAAKATGPMKGIIDAGPIGAGTYFPPMFKISAN
mmetsp:Transcript_70486/g.206706  ORF Transcript_70486/g.206706 Transcript_70486/m.206706 type:complete len:702 (+) Transcript_70486:100-2205(+)